MSEPIVRTFAAQLTRGGVDERTLGGLCVPYNSPATVSDDGGKTTYREMFAPGAFGRQLGAARRVSLKYRHGGGVLDTVGAATQLEERDDGLFGIFRVFDGIVGDQALTLVDEGVLGGLSIGGIPVRSTRTADGTVVRQRVHLNEISLCEEPAYAGAVLSVRRSRVELDLPARPSSEQLDRLAALGIRVDR